MANPKVHQVGTKTSEEFVTRSPLYVVESVDDFHPPDQISFECDGECAKETTWGRLTAPALLDPPNPPDPSIKSVSYMCLRCKEKFFTVIYREMKHEERAMGRPMATGLSKSGLPPLATFQAVVGVMKIGEYPPPSVALPPALSKNLGPDAAALYRKGLQCRNNGFGLAAVGYIRRVVEDKTNELIEVAAALAESHGVDAALVAKMRQAASSIEYTRYEDKLQFAATVFPDSLKVGSINPLGTLYGLVSKGIHGLNEAQCIEIADQTTGVFDFIFTNLRAEVADRKAFADKVKKLSAYGA